MADIMLVLLIIFMITTPMMQKGITVNLPKGTNVIEMPEADTRDATVVTLEHSGKLYFVNRPVGNLDEMKVKLQEAKETKMDDQIFLKSDMGVNYQRIVQSLEVIRDSGFEVVGLLIDEKK